MTFLLPFIVFYYCMFPSFEDFVRDLRMFNAGSSVFQKVKISALTHSLPEGHLFNYSEVS